MEGTLYKPHVIKKRLVPMLQLYPQTFVEFVNRVPVSLLGFYSLNIPLFARRLIFHIIRKLTAVFNDRVFGEDCHYFAPQRRCRGAVRGRDVVWEEINSAIQREDSKTVIY